MCPPGDPAPTSPYDIERVPPEEAKYVSYQLNPHQYLSENRAEAQNENIFNHTALLEGGFQVVRGDLSIKQTQG